MQASLTSLNIMRMPGPGVLWQLQRDLIYEKEGLRIRAPMGMIADGNSGPFKNSERESAGWIHDLLYRIDGFNYITPRIHYSRLWADQMYREVAKVDGASTVATYLDFLVLRAVGRPSWRQKYVLGVTGSGSRSGS